MEIIEKIDKSNTISNFINDEFVKAALNILLGNFICSETYGSNNIRLYLEIWNRLWSAMYKDDETAALEIYFVNLKNNKIRFTQYDKKKKKTDEDEEVDESINDGIHLKTVYIPKKFINEDFIHVTTTIIKAVVTVAFRDEYISIIIQFENNVYFFDSKNKRIIKYGQKHFDALKIYTDVKSGKFIILRKEVSNIFSWIDDGWVPIKIGISGMAYGNPNRNKSPIDKSKEEILKEEILKGELDAVLFEKGFEQYKTCDFAIFIMFCVFIDNMIFKQSLDKLKNIFLSNSMPKMIKEDKPKPIPKPKLYVPIKPELGPNEPPQFATIEYWKIVAKSIFSGSNPPPR